MRILGIVPARAGSRRVPGKNLRILGGRTLVERAIDLGLACGSLTDLCVSSDDRRVLAIATSKPPAIALTRPAELAGDESPAIDYVRHALETLEGERASYDAVVILQPTSPLTVPADVEATIELLRDSGADSAVSIVKLAHDLHPAKLKRLEGSRLLPYLEDEGGRMSAHELPPVYVRNCSVYATRRHVIESGRILGDDCRGHVMPRERSVDVNDELDLEFARFLLRQARKSSAHLASPQREAS